MRKILAQVSPTLLPLLPSSINWYNVTQWFRFRGLAALADVWLRATEPEISAALCPCGSGFFNDSEVK